MSLQSGTLLKSTATDAGDFFANTIIFIAEYNVSGATGFIVNKVYPRNVNELAEFTFLPDMPLYEGGPMDQEHLYFIHRRPDVIEEGTRVGEGIYYGGNFAQATEAIAAAEIATTDVLVFIGYCGWDAGDLEAEIENGDWKEVMYNLF